eukprot:gene6640-8215_t
MDKSTKVLFDVFVSDPLPVNRQIYRSWLDGLSEKETALKRNDTTVGSWPLLLGETEDQFRNYQLLQKVLEHPKTLSSHSMFQMDPQSRKLLIEGYYDFDDILMRDLIGRKLTSGQRRDLDDTSEKLKLRLSSCERQFDNLKRISRLVFAEVKTSALDIIISEFSLSRDLSKFDLSKKRIQSLNTFDLIRLSEIVMNNWGDPFKAYTLEIDLKLKEDVRDLKTHLMSQKDIPEKYWKLIKSRYQYLQSSPKILPSSTSTSNLGSSLAPGGGGGTTPHSLTPTLQPSTSTYYSSTSTSLPNNPIGSLGVAAGFSSNTNNPGSTAAIGSSLSDSKEFRNLFEDIVEKIIDPLKRIDLAINEADSLFELLRETFVPENLGLHPLRHKERIVHNWKSFLEGIRGVVLYMYNNI